MKHLSFVFTSATALAARAYIAGPAPLAYGEKPNE